MSNEGRDDWMASHWAAQRDAGAVTLNMLTGDVQASLDLILPRSTDEHIAVISALASDLAIALRKVHGGQEAAIEHLREHLRILAQRH
ncbi:hypothetical protein [Streptomyces sp. ME19-01-6]|uniref:hypothetical protein n=1 Tax=Streptomyces sp. ME19-01-6 TaxID=3028686 RepID=UPI0029AED27A|nr:hypothetical protein [Streptomyces sp. ME19-01-6]MDX3229406.1 hypothetical protein [Streptomyces sp. ME19-01-6]